MSNLSQIKQQKAAGKKSTSTATKPTIAATVGTEGEEMVIRIPLAQAEQSLRFTDPTKKGTVAKPKNPVPLPMFVVTAKGDPCEFTLNGILRDEKGAPILDANGKPQDDSTTLYTRNALSFTLILNLEPGASANSDDDDE